MKNISTFFVLHFHDIYICEKTMGYSSEAIFMNPRISETEELALLKNLGFEEYVFNRKAPFDEADLRGKYGVYIGHLNNSSFIIYDKMLYEDLRMDTLSPLERTLSTRYPDKAFLSIMNYEVINAYLYHYFKNGETIRLKQGLDPYIFLNLGEELEIEKQYYVRKELEDGQEIFYTQHWDKENSELVRWHHHQIGGAVAFKLVKMLADVEYSHWAMSELEMNQYVPAEGRPEISAETIENELRKRYQQPIEVKNDNQKTSNQNPDEAEDIQEEAGIAELALSSYGFDLTSSIFTRNEIQIDVPPSVVWECLNDFKLWPTWHSAISSPKTLEEFRKGATDPNKLSFWNIFAWRFRGMNLHGRVIIQNTNQKIAWSAGNIGIVLYFQWQLIKNEKGCRIILKTGQRGWFLGLLRFFTPKHADPLQSWLEDLQKRALYLSKMK